MGMHGSGGGGDITHIPIFLCRTHRIVVPGVGAEIGVIYTGVCECVQSTTTLSNNNSTSDVPETGTIDFTTMMGNGNSSDEDRTGTNEIVMTTKLYDNAVAAIVGGVIILIAAVLFLVITIAVAVIIVKQCRTNANTVSTHSDVAYATAGCIEVVENQAYGTNTVPTDPNVAYGTVDCIEVDANQAYGTNTIPTDPNVAYGTVDCIEVDANQAYGTSTVPTDPHVYSTVDYVEVADYVDVANPLLLGDSDEVDGIRPPEESGRI